MAERIKQYFLAWMLPSTYPTLCYKEIHVSVKIRAYSHWNFVSDSGLRVRHSTSVIATCCHISWIKVDAQCGKLATALSWQYLRRSTSDRWHRAWHRTRVHMRGRCARRAGPSATANTYNSPLICYYLGVSNNTYRLCLKLISLATGGNRTFGIHCTVHAPTPSSTLWQGKQVPLRAMQLRVWGALKSHQQRLPTMSG